MRGRSFGFWLAAIVGAGLVVRVVHTLLVAPWPPGFFNDEAYYQTLAALISRGEGFVRPAEFFGDGVAVPTAERAPLFPALLAGVAELGGGDDAQRLLNAVLGAGTIAVVGVLGRRLAGDRAGLIAAALAALYPTLIAADGALMTEPLYGLLAALALLAAYRVAEAPGVGRATALGALVALAALARGEALLLFPLLLLPLLRRPHGVRTAGIAVLAFLVVLAPWTIRNWTTFDRPVLVATEAGETLRGANCDPAYEGDGLGGWHASCVEFSGRGNEAEELNAEGRDALGYIGDHAGRVPVVLGARLVRTWGHPDWPFGVPVEGRAEWVTDLGLLVYLALIPLAAYGFVLLRRRRVPVWIICAPLVTVTLTTLLAYGTLRFRHSAELTLVVLAAVAVDRLLERRRPPPPAPSVA